MGFLTDKQYDSLYPQKSDHKMVTDFMNNKFKSKPYYEYGGYIIQDKNITLQFFRYIPQFALALCTFKGNIVDNSTIYISSCEMNKRPEYCRENFYFKFIKMSKPDSTNRLMKNNWYWQK
ncbi:MAG: hypothetical protein WKF59_11420 [Chitinophagaceae bacterium]